MKSQRNLMATFECVSCNTSQIMKLDFRLPIVYCIIYKRTFPRQWHVGYFISTMGFLFILNCMVRRCWSILDDCEAEQGMSAERPNEETFWTVEVIVVSSMNSENTLTAVFLTQTGAEAFKEMLSQPKVSMHSSLSQAEAPDYRNKHNPA